MTRWDLVYKWADPDTRSIVDAVTSALENCDRKLTEAASDELDVERLAEAILRHDANDSWPSGSQVAHDRGHCGNNRCAIAIAAEYTRLSHEHPLTRNVREGVSAAPPSKSPVPEQVGEDR